MNQTKQIDTYIHNIADWRGDMMAVLRKLIHQADPEIEEVWKWNTPVFTHNGMVCAIGAFKDHIKINFFQGAALSDPHKLFNAGLDAKKTRAIDYYENDTIDEEALKDLLCEAVEYNAG